MTKVPKKAVIFDMDGTLIDSSQAIANAINYVRSHHDLPPMSYEHIISHVNDHTIDPAKFFYEIERFEPIHERLFTEYFSKNHENELKLYDGILDLLQWLHARGIKLAIATNAYHNSTENSLEHFGISELFDSVVCADDVAEGKPAPDMLYRILDELSIQKEETLFVGDGPRDEEAAQAAGIDYLMVDWGFTDHESQKRVIRDVDELKEVLKKLI